jgi:hypothetical protein
MATVMMIALGSVCKFDREHILYRENTFFSDGNSHDDRPRLCVYISSQTKSVGGWLWMWVWVWGCGCGCGFVCVYICTYVYFVDSVIVYTHKLHTHKHTHKHTHTHTAHTHTNPHSFVGVVEAIRKRSISGNILLILFPKPSRILEWEYRS